MIWKLFGSEQRVQEALDQSVGYDISPKFVQTPANETKPQASVVDKPATKPEFYFVAPWGDKQA